MGWPARAGFTLEVSVTVVGEGVAVPVSRMLWGTTPVPLKTTEPVEVPAAMGRSSRFSVQAVPAERVIGRAEQVPPVAVVKPVLAAMVETVIDAVPVFARVTVCGGLGTSTSSDGKFRVGSVPERRRWLSLSAMETLPDPSGATERGELRMAAVERPASPP
jgi:hypothetical protein